MASKKCAYEPGIRADSTTPKNGARTALSACFLHPKQQFARTRLSALRSCPALELTHFEYTRHLIPALYSPKRSYSPSNDQRPVSLYSTPYVGLPCSVSS